MKQRLSAAMKQFSSASAANQCGMLAFLCLCVFVLDISIAGGGRYCMIGPLSLRMMLAGLAFLLCIPCFVQRFRSTVTNPVLLMFCVFLAYLLVCAVRGWLGNGRLNVLISDLKGFAWLFLVPVMIVLVTDRSRFEKLLTVIVIGGVIQATIVHTTNFLCSFILDNSKVLEVYFIEKQLGTINRITNDFYRIFMNSSPYMAIACAIALVRQAQAGKVILRYTLAIIWMLCAALLSFTRSLYGCFFVVALCTVISIFVLLRTQWKHHIILLTVTVVAAGCMLFVTEFAFNANYLNFAMARTFGTEIRSSVAMDLRAVFDEWLTLEVEETTQVTNAQPQPVAAPASEIPTTSENPSSGSDMDHQQEFMDMTQSSDALRIQTQRELLALIAANPIIGNGLGAYAPVRDTGTQPDTDGLDEYFYLDMLARTGIVGLLLYMLPFGYILIRCLKERGQLIHMPIIVAFLCGMLGFWIITWFNPWMNAVLGITAYAMCCSIPQLFNSSTNKSVNTTKNYV